MHDENIEASKVSLGDMLTEAKRELGLRRSVYPGLVANGKLREEWAQLHLHRMEAIVKFFEWAVPREAEIRALHASSDAYRKASRGQ